MAAVVRVPRRARARRAVPAGERSGDLPPTSATVGQPRPCPSGGRDRARRHGHRSGGGVAKPPRSLIRPGAALASPAMPTNRMEAFSDGVIAILITVMVLEL